MKKSTERCFEIRDRTNFSFAQRKCYTSNYNRENIW